MALQTAIISEVQLIVSLHCPSSICSPSLAMGACASKQGSDEVNFSSLEHADGKPKASSAASDVSLPPSSSRYYAVAAVGGVEARDGAVAPAEEERKRPLDPADFILSKRSDSTIVREPGQIAGQSFIIEDCTNCDIFLLDHSAAVNIDQCTDCRVSSACTSSHLCLSLAHRYQLVVAQLTVCAVVRGCADLRRSLRVLCVHPGCASVLVHRGRAAAAST